MQQTTENKYINYRCKIEGTFQGEGWLYQDTGHDKSGIYFPDDIGHEYFYWQQGNMSCDCNRSRFIARGVRIGWSDKVLPCGETIHIDKISPIDDDTIPVIILNESYPPKPVVFDTTQITSKENGSDPQPGDPCHPLVKNGHVPLLIQHTYSDNQNRGFRTHTGLTPPLLRNMGTGVGNVPFIAQKVAPIAFGWQNSEQQGYSVRDISPTLDKSKTPAVYQPIVLNDQGGSVMNVSQNGQAPTLRAQTHAHEPIICLPINTMTVQGRPSDNGRMGLGIGDNGDPQNTLSKAHCHAVATGNDNILIRRLTPKECGRLQGFPDGYLEQVPGYSDSKAYAAFGNSMTTYVMQWIGSRIQLVDSAMKELAAKNTDK